MPPWVSVENCRVAALESNRVLPTRPRFVVRGARLQNVYDSGRIQRTDGDRSGRREASKSFELELLEPEVVRHHHLETHIFRVRIPASPPMRRSALAGETRH